MVDLGLDFAVGLACGWLRFGRWLRFGSRLAGWLRHDGIGVLGHERVVDVEQHPLLAIGQHGVSVDSAHHAGLLVTLVEQAGLDVQLLGRDAQCLGQLLEDLGAGLAQPALNLAQVRVGHPGVLGQATQRDSR